MATVQAHVSWDKTKTWTGAKVSATLSWSKWVVNQRAVDDKEAMMRSIAFVFVLAAAILFGALCVHNVAVAETKHSDRVRYQDCPASDPDC